MSGNGVLGFLVFYPILGSILSYGIGKYKKAIRDIVVQMICISECLIFSVLLFQFLQKGETSYFVWKDFCGFGLHFVLDGFRVLYGMIAAFMWALTSLLSKQYFGHYRNRNRYYLFYLLTLGATIGVFLSADLYTTFIFFEIMSFTSYVWVAHDENAEAMRAALTYLAVAVIGGLVMLMGIFLLYSSIGTLTISEIVPAIQNSNVDRAVLYAAGGCMLFGFGAKAGMFPLHIWLPKAHPVAPAPASALLSGILTKAGIFGILVISCQMFMGDGIWGSLILLLGVCTMVIGAVLAIFSVNLKRTLACSSVSQIGFILTGVGMNCLLADENALAVRGSLLHMVNHSLIKLVLFMAAGVVFMNIHQLDLNEVRGFGHKKPCLHFAFLMGALGIGGIPLWNGYVSKTLIHESIVEYIELLKEGHRAVVWFDASAMKMIEWAFLISGGMTVAYMTKLYFCLFIEKNESKEKQDSYDAMSGSYMTISSKIALVLSGILLPIMGFFPQMVMNKMADLGQGFMNLQGEVEPISYFALQNLKGGLISIGIGVVLYFAVIRTLFMQKREDKEQKAYVDIWPKWLDLENMIYRPVLLLILPFIFGVACRILDCMVDTIVVLLRKTIYKDSPLPHELEEGTPMTYIIGTFLDAMKSLWGKLSGKETKEKVSYTHKLANWQEDMNENLIVLSRSMSFGLLLFCGGLLITVIYMLLK